MAGPYDYVTPNYWFEDRKNGGAFGFNTETGPGPQIPPMATLKRMIPEDKRWPLNEVWDYHCARHSFGNLSKFMTAFNARYGAATSAEDLAFRSQIASFEAMRGMFDAFGANRGEATGVIQWMLNGSWPKMFWQLYDSYLMPNGAFYAARAACRPLNVIHDPVRNTVLLLNETRTDLKDAKLRVRILDAASKTVFEQDLTASCGANATRKALDLPKLDSTSPVHFIDLRLTHNGQELARNFYWVSAKADVLDPSKGDWTYMPNKEWADFTSLNALPKAKVLVTKQLKPGAIEVTLKNTSEHLAFGLELQLNRKGEPILPILWDDNDFALLPGETRTIKATFAKGAAPELSLKGWNLEVP
jgi:exo-1,4-beta-D-glucosaminidase